MPDFSDSQILSCSYSHLSFELRCRFWFVFWCCAIRQCPWLSAIFAQCSQCLSGSASRRLLFFAQRWQCLQSAASRRLAVSLYRGSACRRHHETFCTTRGLLSYDTCQKISSQAVKVRKFHGSAGCWMLHVWEVEMSRAHACKLSRAYLCMTTLHRVETD